MYQTTLQYFAKICAIPHGSFHTQELFTYLKKELTELGFSVISDTAYNIYAKKGKPVCCLQGHYDMVCVGKAAQNLPIQTYEEHKEECVYLRAKDSSLGADNGIALACMLALGLKYKDIEFLITNDEEVGMLGAKNLQIPIESDVLLNLDSEDINEIVLGCAGGVDISAKKNLKPTNRRYNTMFIIKAFGFKGGHSGIDIHKNIPNAIVEFAHFLNNLPCQIISLKAGEKRNSIPVGVECVVVANNDFKQYAQEAFCITHYDTESNITDGLTYKIYEPSEILNPILALHSGVYEIESQSGSVIDSLNLSCVYLNDNGVLELDLFARANDDEKLSRMQLRIQILLNQFGFDVSFSDFYSAWKRNISDDDILLKELINLYEIHYKRPHIAQIHAGLECGILQQKFLALKKPTPTKILSIGPSIDFPHSTKEQVNLKSVEVFVTILEALLQKLGAKI